MPRKNPKDYDGSKPLVDPRQENFCQEFCNHYFAYKAYLSAYYPRFDQNKNEFTEEDQKTINAAKGNASRLINSVDNVKKRLRWMAEQARKGLDLGPDGVKKLIQEIASSDISDFVHFDGENVRIKPLNMVNGRLIQEIAVSKDGQAKIKLYEKRSSIDALARIEKLLVDHHEISGEMLVHQQIDSDEAYRRRMAKLRGGPVEEREKAPKKKVVRKKNN